MLKFWKVEEGKLYEWTIGGQNWMECFVPQLRQLTSGGHTAEACRKWAWNSPPAHAKWWPEQMRAE